MSNVIHYFEFLDYEFSLDIFEVLKYKVPWMGGKDISKYFYIGDTCTIIEELKRLVVSELGVTIYGTYGNYYRNNTYDGSYHHEKYGCHILILSFGSSKNFCLKSPNKFTPDIFTLASGDALYLTHNANMIYKQQISQIGSGIDIIFLISKPL